MDSDSTAWKIQAKLVDEDRSKLYYCFAPVWLYDCVQHSGGHYRGGGGGGELPPPNKERL